jgi:hypothetical protein
VAGDEEVEERPNSFGNVGVSPQQDSIAPDPLDIVDGDDVIPVNANICMDMTMGLSMFRFVRRGKVSMMNRPLLCHQPLKLRGRLTLKLPRSGKLYGMLLKVLPSLRDFLQRICS